MPQNRFTASIRRQRFLVGHRKCGWVGGGWGRGPSSPAETMHGAALLFNHHYQSRQAGSKSGIFPQLRGRTRQRLRITLQLENIADGRRRWLFSQPIRRCLHVCSSLLVIVTARLHAAPVPERQRGKILRCSDIYRYLRYTWKSTCACIGHIICDLHQQGWSWLGGECFT